MKCGWWLGACLSLGSCSSPDDTARAGASSVGTAVEVVGDPGCREDVEFADVLPASRPTKLPLSLAKFGPPPAGKGLTAWGTPDPVTSTCRTVGTSDPRPSGFYRGGGFIQQYCTYAFGTRPVTSHAELVAALAPIDSPRKALGLVSVAHRLAFEEDLAAGKADKAVRFPATQDPSSLAVFDVASFTGGFIVRVPLEHLCPRSIQRVALRVTTAGDICFAKEPTVVLDVGDGRCVD